MRIERHYTKAGVDPLHDILWDSRVSEIKNSDGSGVFRQEDVIVPSFWSQTATDILAQKYFRKTGVVGTGRETDARQVFDRLARCWMVWGKRHAYFDSEEDAAAFYDEMLYMLAHQVGAPNSPQWFNTGLHLKYGIKGAPSGQWYVPPATGTAQPAENSYENPTVSACFIVPVKDNLVGPGGIMDLWQTEARIFKFGSGSGVDVSSLRAQGEPLSGGGTSSGVMSFLKIGDSAAGSIKSGGTTRRAALLRALHISHPDIEKFIQWKAEEEYKVVSLVAGSRAAKRAFEEIKGVVKNGSDPKTNKSLRKALGKAKRQGVPAQYLKRVLDLAQQGSLLEMPEEFDTDWQGGGYGTVSGQNSNNSVRVPNEFFDKLLQNGTWDTTWRTTGKVARSFKAVDLWEKIAQAAWACADPGLQFDTTINEWHTCPKGGRINASNPCSEYLFLDNTSCNLASLNLVRFYKDGKFDVQAYLHAIKLWTLTLEISVLMTSSPSQEIAQNTHDYRTLGLGYANLGALLMRMGFAYDSDEARDVAASLTAILTGEAYKTSALIAKDKGPFPNYRANASDMLRVIRNHRSASYGNTSPSEYEGLSVLPKPLSNCVMELSEPARKSWDAALELGNTYGYRNAQVSVIAPTGTIGLVMDCDTTGVEPDFSLVKFKKLAGGGSLKIINQSVPQALTSLGYAAPQVKEIIQYAIGAASLASGGCPINQDSLLEKGLEVSHLPLIESRLPSAFHVREAFSRHVLGDKFYTKLGVSEEISKSPAFNLLTFLGFTESEVAQANAYYCGAMTVEGAPHLRDEHYPIFACATRCGKTGQQYIPHMAHVDMLAAVQPFVSGAISKTINMPQDSTVGDVKRVYLESWQKMLKAVAIYRDASKLSQALSGGSDWDLEPEVQEEKAPENLTDMFKAHRRVLPNRRVGYTQKVNIGGHKIYLRTGQYEDGTLGEIFLDMSKEGAAFRSLMNSLAIAISLGLQHGVPLDEYVEAFVGTRFEPSGVVQGHDQIKMSSSLLDYVFRDLGSYYLDRQDLVHIKSPLKETRPPVYDLSADARELGYTGDICPSCGSSKMVRNGTCSKCESCGDTTGCS